MRRILSLGAAAALALALGACQDRPTEPTQGPDLEASSQAPAASQANRGGQGEGAVFFDPPFLLGFHIPDAETDDDCVVRMSRLDLNDFVKRQPNGHQQIHVQDRAAEFFVYTDGEPRFAGDFLLNPGEADLTGEGSFTSSLVVNGDFVILNLSVNATGTVGDGRRIVCKGQFNRQGPIHVDMELR